MLCRTSTLRHTDSGVSITTPLLIPSFSSKGFTRSPADGKSEIGAILETVSEFLTEAFLISAYDVFHGDLPRPEHLPCKPEIVFVDSGGYEVSTYFDYASAVVPPMHPKAWTTENLESVLDDWPNEVPAVFVNFDHPGDRKSFAEQVEDARRLFRKRRQHLTLFLLKPETKDQNTLQKAIRSAVANVGDLGSFDIIGVTEKELGGTMIERMVRLASLRLAMDDAQVAAPIHVFGSLDPLSVCLYYIAGAEIFDGLTWLRYAYSDGLCVYMHNHGIRYGLHVRDAEIRSRAIADNCYTLQGLQQQLVTFEATRDFDKLEPHAKIIADARDALKARFKGRL